MCPVTFVAPVTFSAAAARGAVAAAAAVDSPRRASAAATGAVSTAVLSALGARGFFNTADAAPGGGTADIDIAREKLGKPKIKC